MMKRRVKLTIAMLLLGIAVRGVDFGRPSRNAEEASALAAVAAQKNVSPKQPPHERAKTLYADSCTRCHGADGRGQTPMGRAFGVTDLTDAGWWKKERVSDKRLTAAIRNGRGEMPAFGRQFSKEEIAALVAFVKTFNGK